MKKIAALGFALLMILGMNSIAHAAAANPCKQCSDQRKACKTTYSDKTCDKEFQMCMTSCREKKK